MATAGKPSPERQPISPATRRRLQQCFEHGNRSSSQGHFDYADDMLTSCVTGDPGNKLYAQSFLSNLQKKYNNNKKGSKLASISGMGTRAALQKASMQKDWKALVDAAVKLLKLNPWDTSALAAMAMACDAQDQEDAQLVYLKAALDTNLKDPELNRHYGRGLANTGQFDQALVAWQRVIQAKPDDEEAARAIHNLTVEKTIKEAGYDTAESTQEVKSESHFDTGAALATEAGVMTPERQLERAIAKNPAEVQNYIKLYELFYGREDYDLAEQWLTKGVEVSGGSLILREQLEDLKLKRQREHLATARRRADSEKTAEAIELYKRLAADANRTEIEIYRSRSERYPTNLSYRFELAVRLHRSGNYPEAIKQYQEARADSNRRGQVYLALGECFYRIKQMKLAMSNFETAVKEIQEDREPEQKKQALYYAGSLAMGLKDWEKAEKYLTELAGIDYSYKDVAERLDKVSHERNKE